MNFLFLLLLIIGALDTVHTDYDNQLRTRDHIDRILLPHNNNEELSDDEETTVQQQKQFILKRLVKVLKKKIEPAELQFHYKDLERTILTSSNIFAKPAVLVLGPKGTGKTTAINYILGENIAEHSKSFTLLNYGKQSRTLSGQSLESSPFWWQQIKAVKAVENHLTIKESPNGLLAQLSFIDSPGITNDNDQLLKNLANQADLIIVIFDTNNIQIDKHLGQFLSQLNGQQKTLRIVLNKADRLTEHEMVHKSGQLHWSLSRLLNVSERPKIYMTSLKGHPYAQHHAQLLTEDEQLLLKDLRAVIDDHTINKIKLVRRYTQRIRSHALLVDSFLLAYRQNRRTSKKEDKELARCIINFPEKYGVNEFERLRPSDFPYSKEYTRYFKDNHMNKQKLICETCANIEKCPFNLLNHVIEIDLPKLLALAKNAGDDAKEFEKDTTNEARPIFSQESESEQKQEKTEQQEIKHVDDEEMKEQEQNEVYQELEKQEIEQDIQDEGENEQNDEEEQKEAALALTLDQEDPYAFEQPINRSGSENDAADAETDIKHVVESGELTAESTRATPALAGNEGMTQASAPTIIVDSNDNTLDTPTDERKFYCHFRKSCYQTGIVPDLSIPIIVVKHEDETIEHLIVDEERYKKQRCHWRKSCYDTGIIPKLSCSTSIFSFDIFNIDFLPTTQKSQPHREDENDVNDENDEEKEIAAMKQRCLWRKSCYETGILPDLSQTSTIIIKTASEDEVMVPDNDAIIRQRCKWRKSCYIERGVEPIHHYQYTDDHEDEKENVKHEDSTPPNENKDEIFVDQTEDTETSEGTVDDETAITDKFKQSCRWRKSCYETGVVPDLVALVHHPITPQARDVDEDELVDFSHARMKQGCHWRKSCYETGDVPDLSGSSWFNIFKGPVVQEQEKESSDNPDQHDNDDTTITDNHGSSDDEDYKIKMMCKFRKSCYDTGEVPSLPLWHWYSILPEAFTQSSIAEVEIEENFAQMKQRCKWIKSCYDKLPESDIPESPRKPAETPVKQETSHEQTKGHSSKAAEMNEEEQHIPTDNNKNNYDDDEKDGDEQKQFCHWRKSCYETGVIPDLTKATFVITTLSKDIEEVVESEAHFKQHCLWRKTCYESGIRPDLTLLEVSDQQSEIGVEANDVDEEDEEYKKKFKCHFRKSCYETGIHVVPQTLKATIVYAHADIETASTEDIFNVKEYCKWRKSCYEQFEIESPEAQPLTSSQTTKKQTPKGTEKQSDHKERITVGYKKDRDSNSDDEQDQKEEKEDEEEKEEDREKETTQNEEESVYQEVYNDETESLTVADDEQDEDEANILESKTIKPAEEMTEVPRTGAIEAEDESDESRSSALNVEDVEVEPKDMKSDTVIQEEEQITYKDIQIAKETKITDSNHEEEDDDDDDDDEDKNTSKQQIEELREVFEKQIVDDQESKAEQQQKYGDVGNADTQPEVDYDKERIVEEADQKELQEKQIVDDQESQAAQQEEYSDVEIDPDTQPEVDDDKERIVEEADQKELQEKQIVDDQESQAAQQEEYSDVEIDPDIQPEVDDDKERIVEEADQKELQEKQIVDDQESQAAQQKEYRDVEIDTDAQPEVDDDKERIVEEAEEVEHITDDQDRNEDMINMHQRIETMEHPPEAQTMTDNEPENEIIKPDSVIEKQACLWRLSCYQTGIIPDVTHTTPITSQSVLEQVDIEGDNEATMKQKCRWRKSCFETCIIPDLRISPQVTAHEEVDEDDATDDSEDKQYKLKVKCHFRKSCYESGVVPDLTKSNVVPIFFPISESVQKEDMTNDQLKQICKWKLSCYQLTGLLEKTAKSVDTEKDIEQIQTLKEKPKKPKKVKSEKDVKEKHKKKHKRQKNKTDASLQMDTDNISDSNDSKKQVCKWRKSCYESGVLPDLSKPLTITYYGDQVVSETAEETEAQMKQRCHWRQSCYQTGIVPETFKIPVQPSAEPQPVDVDEQEEHQKLQMKCHFRKSCYETGDVPDLSKAWVVPIDSKEQETPEIEESEVAFRQRCRWRKSCYDSGILPDFESLEKEKETPATIAAKLPPSEDEIGELKCLCQYRIHCYEEVMALRPDIDSDILRSRVSSKKEQIAQTADLSTDQSIEASDIQQQNESRMWLVYDPIERCNIYRLSCRHAVGLPPKQQNNKGHSDQAKKMCRRFDAPPDKTLAHTMTETLPTAAK